VNWRFPSWENLFGSDAGPKLLLIVLAIAAVALILPGVFGYILVAGIVIAIAAGVGVVGYVIWWLLRNRLAPVRRVTAQVIRKRHKQWDVSVQVDTPEVLLGLTRPSDMDDMTLTSGADCHVTFGFNGQEVEFIVPAETYISVTENDSGLLFYQGEQFRHFVKRSERSPAGDPASPRTPRSHP
jgi:hypothetical protein